MSADEWESLCDGCGRCCVHKVQDDETGEIHYTNIACRYFDADACRCAQYAERRRLVPGCAILTHDNIGSLSWLPDTCAYRLLHRDIDLPRWHPLVSGDPDSTRNAGMSVRGPLVPEEEARDLAEHILNDSASVPRLVLASKSPRRREIMGKLGVPFECASPDVLECLHVEDPARTARENAALKNRWCANIRPDAWIVAADTVLEHGGRCIGKPLDRADAACMLASLSGKTHRVITATAMSAPGLDPEVHTEVSGVTFRTIENKDIHLYLAQVDPLDKAGSYDINDHGDLIIAGLEGSRTNVMGLSEEIVSVWLREAGILVPSHDTE